MQILIQEVWSAVQELHFSKLPGDTNAAGQQAIFWYQSA